MIAVAKMYQIGLAMLFFSVLAFFLTPKEVIGHGKVKIELEGMIPRGFKDWREDGVIVPVKIDPRLEEMLGTIYSQTLTRTYINKAGHRIMLSIAYGGKQSKSLQVHRPEVCYSAQGFNVGKVTEGEIRLPDRVLPVSRLIATQDRRNEPITYWIRVGDDVARSRYDQMLSRYKYGLTGQVPDGVLVRVSSITDDVRGAYSEQDQFVSDLLVELPVTVKEFLIGIAGRYNK